MSKKYSVSHVCKILKEHAENLKDDPERLSTDFIVGVCVNEIDKGFENITTNVHRDDKEFDKDRLVEIAQINKIKRANGSLSRVTTGKYTVLEAVEIAREKMTENKRLKEEKRKKKILEYEKKVEDRRKANIEKKADAEKRALIRMINNDKILKQEIDRENILVDNNTSLLQLVNKAKERLARKKELKNRAIMTKPKRLRYPSIFRKNTGWD